MNIVVCRSILKKVLLFAKKQLYTQYKNNYEYRYDFRQSFST